MMQRTTAKGYSERLSGKRKGAGVRSFVNRLFRSRWYRTLVLRYSLAAIISIICIPMMLSLIVAQPAEANDGSEEVFYKYYHRIEVAEGDTLWSIRSRIMFRRNRRFVSILRKYSRSIIVTARLSMQEKNL